MERSEESGIRIYTPSPQINRDPPSPPSQSTLSPPLSAANGGGRKKLQQTLTKGVQKTLSKTSMLVNFLPTGTLLTFEMVLPSIYGKGRCLAVATLMINILLAICTFSCFFFHFTDSFRAPDGKIYYGFVTPSGLKVFKPTLTVEVPKDDRYKVGITDFIHAMMSSMVFMAIAFSDHRVTYCLFPEHAKEMDEVMQSFPLMVGIVCSGLFLVFPNTRYGIGCLSA
ncbi:protein DMP9-like [Cynara cardunculus var. scolymus]|uniref:Uncharacterized protein n=1 Tax=Cynara cardunculus var. scolymus TaxID=59895 RepID=A0A103YAH4_CYNCS|nr:protein DMP9-like [Cynara cardunculus var. scolymus]KVI05513.1 hypothetical protein Ccrd_016130 [Cynara cardunculus var. scolymus]